MQTVTKRTTDADYLAASKGYPYALTAPGLVSVEGVSRLKGSWKRQAPPAEGDRTPAPVA